MASFFSKFQYLSRNGVSRLQNWWLYLSDLFEWAVRLVSALHQVIMAAVIVAAQIIPLIGLLVEGVGLLCEPIRSLFKSQSTPVSTPHLGLKVIAGLLIVACGVCGFLFPPAGLVMVLVGLGVSVAYQAYSTRRTAKSRSGSQSSSEPSSELSSDEVDKQLKQRGARLGLSCINMALLTATLVFPPAAVFTLSALVAINLGVAVYQYYQYRLENNAKQHCESLDTNTLSTDDSISISDSGDSMNEENDPIATQTYPDQSTVNSTTQVESTAPANQLTTMNQDQTEGSNTLPTPIKPTTWSSQMVFAVGATVCLAGYFDIAMLMVITFMTSFRMLSHVKNNQVVSTQSTGEPSSPVDPHHAEINHFLDSTTHQVTPAHANDYQDSHPDLADTIITNPAVVATDSSAPAITDQHFLDDQVHVLATHQLPSQYDQSVITVDPNLDTVQEKLG